jgi:hypothetical protein
MTETGAAAVLQRLKRGRHGYANLVRSDDLIYRAGLCGGPCEEPRPRSNPGGAQSPQQSVRFDDGRGLIMETTSLSRSVTSISIRAASCVEPWFPRHGRPARDLDPPIEVRDDGCAHPG